MNKVTLPHIKRLTHALDADNKLVCVDDVQTGKRCNCFCPACKEQLVAKNQGQKRIHHFSHKSGAECAHAIESMLHILAKEKIRESFLSNHEFWIEFEHRSYCDKHKNCNFIREGDCYNTNRKRFNLKDYYDSCEQEIAYDNINRRSDLKLFSSTNPNCPPIYLEFCVTHASDSEKLHSENRIIEIKIESEDDISQLVQKGITESQKPHNDIEERNPPKICFYNFKNDDYNNNSINKEIEFFRYILFDSGKLHYSRKYYCDCKNLMKSRSNSLYEICIHTKTPVSYKHINYLCFKKFGIKNCTLCTHYINSTCNKNIQYKEIDSSEALRCSLFNINQKEMNLSLEHELGPYTEFYK